VLGRRREAAAPTDAEPAGDRKAQKRLEAQARQQRYVQRKPLADRLAKLEREIEALQQGKATADAWLATPDAYADENREKLKATVAEQGDATWKLARLESEWLEVAEALERLDEAP
jgi:ATP-binding cassette subfamily F protein 3